MNHDVVLVEALDPKVTFLNVYRDYLWVDKNKTHDKQRHGVKTTSSSLMTWAKTDGRLLVIIMTSCRNWNGNVSNRRP